MLLWESHLTSNKDNNKLIETIEIVNTPLYICVQDWLQNNLGAEDTLWSNKVNYTLMII